MIKKILPLLLLLLLPLSVSAQEPEPSPIPLEVASTDEAFTKMLAAGAFRNPLYADISSPYARYFAPAAADPSSPRGGQVVYRSDLGTVKYYDAVGSAWRTVTTGGGATINSTNNRIPKRLSASAFTDSLLSDDGTNVTLTSGQALAPNGTASAPAYSYSGATVVGQWRDAGVASVFKAENGVFEFRNGTSPTIVRNDDTFTDNSNYRRHAQYWSGGDFYIENQSAGTGSAGLGQMMFRTGTGKQFRWYVGATQGLTYDGNTFNFVTGQLQLLAASASVSGSVTIDFNTGNVQRRTLTGNVTSLTLSNLKDGAEYIITVLQDGTGSRTIAWPSTVKWAGGSAPTLTTTASARDSFSFISDGTNLYERGRALDIK